MPDDFVGEVGELVEVRAKQVERQIGVAPAGADVGNELHAGAHVGVVGQDSPGRGHGLELGPAARPAEQPGPEAAQLGQATVQRGERDIPFGLAHASGGFSQGGQDIGHGGLAVDADGLEPIFDFRADLRRSLERRAFGSLQRDLEFAGVVLGKESELGQLPERAQGEHARGRAANDNPAMTQTPAQHRDIMIRQPAEQRAAVSLFLANLRVVGVS